MAKDDAHGRAEKRLGLRRKAALLRPEADLPDMYARLAGVFALALGCSAFVPLAPALLAACAGALWLTDKYALVRVRPSGWVRGAGALGGARVAGAAAHWLALGVVLHLTFALAGYARCVPTSHFTFK